MGKSIFNNILLLMLLWLLATSLGACVQNTMEQTATPLPTTTEKPTNSPKPTVTSTLKPANTSTQKPISTPVPAVSTLPTIDTVELSTSTISSPQFLMPDVIGMDRWDAQEVLEAQGIAFEIVYESDRSQPEDIVIRTVPNPGERIAFNSIVNLFISYIPSVTNIPSPSPTRVPSPTLTNTPVPQTTNTLVSPPPANMPAPTVSMPNVIGMNRWDAAETLRNWGMYTSIEYILDRSMPENIVLRTVPNPGEQVVFGNGATLYVSYIPAETNTPIPTLVPPQTVSVPNVIGMDSGSASGAIEGSGLLAQIVWGGSGCPPYTVISQSPGGGASVNPGTIVSLTVCEGIVVPNVIGMDKNTASDTISAAGLVPVFAEGTYDGSKPDGMVWATDPGPSSNVSRGTSVTIFYYKGRGE